MHEAHLALDWVARILAFASLISCVEYWRIRDATADTGVWRWSVLRREFQTSPLLLRSLLDLLMSHRGVVAIIGLRALAAVTVLAVPNAPGLWVLFGSALYFAVRWRGSFNGGSDSMTLLVSLASAIGMSASPDSPVALGALWYIALQCCASYFIAGLCKLGSKGWRQGWALPAFLSTACYAMPQSLSRILGVPAFALMISWAVIGLECAFPLSLMSPEAATVAVVAAFFFHLCNVYLLGLNRFLWIWLATYPALVYCSGLLT